MENQVLAGIFRTLVGTLRMESSYRDFALLMLGAALGDARVPVGGLIAMYTAAKDVAPGEVDLELSKAFLEHVKVALDAADEVKDLIAQLKEVHQALVQAENVAEVQA
ncbi:hypothetical protein P23p43 [Thermus phage P23-45]|uniref:Uncharacterized protein n=1 Tax=Thermus virus P23-45 TaxID=2914006 RepID=A7XX69_BP234|nr:hypothetical protein P23p43 [Thermus phage P23-45]ABU96876.1 hypothetical protein P23p43 [Thermus phage P23-45]